MGRWSVLIVFDLKHLLSNRELYHVRHMLELAHHWTMRKFLFYRWVNSDDDIIWINYIKKKQESAQPSEFAAFRDAVALFSHIKLRH